MSFLCGLRLRPSGRMRPDPALSVPFRGEGRGFDRGGSLSVVQTPPKRRTRSPEGLRYIIGFAAVCLIYGWVLAVFVIMVQFLHQIVRRAFEGTFSSSVVRVWRAEGNGNQ